MTKTCIKCGQEKPLDSGFGKRGDGYARNVCLLCMAIWHRENRKRPEVMARNRARAFKLSKPDPAKLKARTLLHTAIRNGTVKRKNSCSECGTRIDAHHADYSKPLEVKWVCSICHGKEHRKHKEEAPKAPLFTKRNWRTIRAALYRAADWSEPVDTNDDWKQQRRERRFIEQCRKLNERIAKLV